MIFAGKIPEFYIIIARKYFPDFFLGGGAGNPLSPFPLSPYAPNPLALAYRPAMHAND